MNSPSPRLILLTLTLTALLPLSAVAAQETSLAELGLPGTLLGIEAGKAGWQEDAPGILRLDALDGRKVYLARGEEGLRSALARMTARTTELVDAFLDQPDAAQLLATHAQIVAELERRTSVSSGRDEIAAASCSGFTIDLQADAGFSGCNNTANAHAGYNTTDIPDCPSCQLYTYAYTRRTCGAFSWDSHDSCSHSGTYNNACDSFTQRTEGFDSCYSYAYAYLSCDEPIGFLWVEDTSNACGTFGCFPSC